MPIPKRFPVCAATAAVLSLPAAAHVPEQGVAAGHLHLRWAFDPWVVSLLVASLVLYATGLARLWRRAGPGRGVRPREAAAFLAGWLVLAAALTSPLDALGNLLFSAHMVQHELLMVVAAPLLLLGRPLAVWTWGMAVTWRRHGPALLDRLGLRALFSCVASPAVAWTLHAVAVWAWHAPALFEAALADDTVHTWQHWTFFASAVLFWWAPIAAATRAARGIAMLGIFTTMLHTGVLGALLTFSPTVWYPAYGPSAALFGIDTLEDQQLGGMLMWVPAGLAYLVAGLALAARTLQLREPPVATAPADAPELLRNR